MKTNVIAIFDIGKTNKKIILFDFDLKIRHEKEVRFSEILDDDGFACDDIVRIEKWIDDTLYNIVKEEKYNVKAINFSTYGATLMYLNEDGERLTPLYNYLKEMPKYIVNDIYEQNNGLIEFTRRTASPALGFLNSGFQIKWLEKEKSNTYKKVKSILHFPQYLSYVYSNRVTSEPTSIGCHTAMWDFDNSKYHSWVSELNVDMPEPVSSSTLYNTTVAGQSTKVGVGIHDSSAALVPYLYANKNEFILVSTGTWAISMNPFNKETLTQLELDSDCLCFMSVNKEQVKSSRLYMGYIHEVNVKMLSDYFNVPADSYKNVELNEFTIDTLNETYGSYKAFFKKGIPENYVDNTVDLSQFSSYDVAYHQLMIDLTWYSIKSIELVIPYTDTSDKIYITGGFAKNDIYVKLISGYFIDKTVYTSEIDNASALGAALVIRDELVKGEKLNLDLGLKECKETLNIEEF
ncbi:MAG: carbohydrate kinase [Ichthyobacteriaceae bacterium]|nr:carbohydrate kinase [Ichthyobacteriaceae bacterium]